MDHLIACQCLQRLDIFDCQQISKNAVKRIQVRTSSLISFHFAHEFYSLVDEPSRFENPRVLRSTNTDTDESSISNMFVDLLHLMSALRAFVLHHHLISDLRCVQSLIYLAVFIVFLMTCTYTLSFTPSSRHTLLADRSIRHSHRLYILVHRNSFFQQSVFSLVFENLSLLYKVFFLSLFSAKVSFRAYFRSFCTNPNSLALSLSFLPCLL